MKQKKCKICKEKFTPLRPLQQVCGYECSILLAQNKRIKSEKVAQNTQKRELAKAKEAIKPRSAYMKEAQAIVNQYVRLRDENLGCVSCDKPATWQGQWHASHFRSVGAASAVRFNLWNIHKSCSICNNWKSGNLSEYEPKLRIKIGDDKVDWLRTQNQQSNYSIEYLKRLMEVFKKKIKRIKKK